MPGARFIGHQPTELPQVDLRREREVEQARLRCYVVVELKAVPFAPAFVGQLNLYLSAVDDLLRHSDDKPTMGLLLCREKNQFFGNNLGLV